MFSNIHIFPQTPNHNIPPFSSASFAKDLLGYQGNGYREDWKNSNKAESQSSNASCDTSIDETLSICSKESKPFSKISYMNPYSSMDIFETGSLDSGEKNQKYDLSDTKKKVPTKYYKQQKKSVSDEAKYKTEMCKKWMETGLCSYGVKCRFAHGKHELQEKFVPNKSAYRSKKCHSFHSNLVCPYGIRCLFAHEARTLDELIQEGEYVKYMYYPDLLKNSMTMNHKRLPVFCLKCPIEKFSEEDKENFQNTENQTEFSFVKILENSGLVKISID